MGDFISEEPFRSKRLVYRSPENNDRDKIFFDLLRKDPSRAIYSNGNLLRPGNREVSDDVFKNFMKHTLAVFICLPDSTDDAKEKEPIHMETSASDTKPSTRISTKDEAEDAGLTPVGVLSIEGGSAGQFEYDVQHRSVMLAISIAKPYRDRGIGREAINWALDWSFRFAGMHSVGLGCYEWNVRGRHLYESLGFVLGGVYRKEYYFDRKWWDGLYYSMLEEEWEAIRKKQQAVGTSSG
jgi:RimJ/RimL family protein N-acetyltransferase